MLFCVSLVLSLGKVGGGKEVEGKGDGDGDGEKRVGKGNEKGEGGRTISRRPKFPPLSLPFCCLNSSLPRNPKTLNR